MIGLPLACIIVANVFLATFIVAHDLLRRRQRRAELAYNHVQLRLRRLL